MIHLLTVLMMLLALFPAVTFADVYDVRPSDHPEQEVWTCDEQTSEDAAQRYYACYFEIERKIIIEFPVAIPRGGATVSLQGDYTRVAGPAGVIKSCITWQQRWVRESGMRVQVFSSCPIEKYLVIELSVPK